MSAESGRWDCTSYIDPCLVRHMLQALRPQPQPRNRVASTIPRCRWAPAWLAWRFAFAVTVVDELEGVRGRRAVNVRKAISLRRVSFGVARRWRRIECRPNQSVSSALNLAEESRRNHGAPARWRDFRGATGKHIIEFNNTFAPTCNATAHSFASVWFPVPAICRKKPGEGHVPSTLPVPAGRYGR